MMIDGNHRLWAVVVTCAALIFAACGGGDDDADSGSSPSTTASAPTTAEPEAPAPTEPAQDAPSDEPMDDTSDEPMDDAGSGSAPEPNRIVVTIGDATYEFDAEAHVVGRCDPDFFGAFWVIAAGADGSPGNLEMLLVPEGNTNHDETSKIKVGVEDIDGRDWRADADGGEGTPEGQSQVESLTIDGNSATGTATFVDIYAGDGATAQGTFAATCP